MAATKVFNSASLAIQIENGVNSSGETIYRKKSFNNVRENANIDDLLAVAKAIGNILSSATGDSLITEVSTIKEQA